MTARKFVLDGDYGVDDAMAALYLATEPDVEIVAVGSVHGNTEAAIAARNAITVLDLVGLDHIPVAVGAARPLAQPLHLRAEVHGPDGLGGAAPAPTSTARLPVDRPAAVQLVDAIRAHPGEVTVLATGPVTNLALALLLDPGIADLVRQVVVMGGTVQHPGTAGPYSEANVAHDPEAADLVFTAGWPVTLVGLDVTMTAWLEEADLDRLRCADSRPARFIWACLQHYLDFYRARHGRTGCPLHDPSAARIAVEPALASYLETPVRVELNSTVNRGMLIVDRRLRGQAGSGMAGSGMAEPPVRIAMAADRDRLVQPLMSAWLS